MGAGGALTGAEWLVLSKEGGCELEKGLMQSLAWVRARYCRFQHGCDQVACVQKLKGIPKTAAYSRRYHRVHQTSAQLLTNSWTVARWLQIMRQLASGGAFHA